MLKKLKKILLAILIVLIAIPTQFLQVLAVSIGDSESLERGDLGFYSVQYNNNGKWMYITYNIVHYKDENGVQRIAYCVDPELDGIGWTSGGVSGYDVDLTELLSNVQMWRVYINGYPYKTPEQMGCETADDAYLATKQAGYWVLKNKPLSEIRSYFRAGQTVINNENLEDIQRRGQKVIDAIYNLVNEAYNGTQTPAHSNIISVNTVGDFKQDSNEDYYSQTYKPTSSVSMASYTIRGIENFPSGSYIANLNGNAQTSFSAGESFKVMVPKTSITENTTGKIYLLGKCATYPVYYGASRDSNYQSYAVCCDPYGDVTAEASLKIDAYKSSIKVIKEDAETKFRIPNVVFNFKYANGENIGNYTTNENGEITVNKLKQGTIIATELETNENYILNTETTEIKLSYAESKLENIQNERKRGNLQVYKVDKDNNKVVLGNVEFDLYSHELNKVVGTYRTDVNGEIFIKDLRVADYSLIEKNTNKWYNLADDVNVEVKWNETTDVTIENELKKGQIKVIKVDSENNEVKLEGVKFGVYDKDNNLLETIVTNEDGEALTQKYAVRDFEQLKLVELETKEEYVLNDTPQTIKLEENQITNIQFENERIKGTVEITKVDKKDNSKVLEGATFGLYDENDNLIETLVTGQDGKATSSELYKGKYYLKELETGSVYYLLNEDTFEFEIVENKEVVPVTIENEPTDITVDVDKEGTTEIKPGEKVNYTFSNVANNSNVYLDNFKWYDYIPTDYIRLETMTTGTWNQDLTYSVYYKTNKSEDYILFKEDLKTTENYDLDFTTIELAEDEYITETCFDFGKVDIGFRENISPTMECISFDTLEDGETFTNHTKTVGVYYGVTAESDSKWTTIVHKPEEKHEVTLPRTGK
jgi:hypothetical protein